MLLAIDIGNTNITFGLFKGERIAKKFTIPTGSYSLRNTKRKIGTVSIDNIVICSVVPKVTKILRQDSQKTLGIKPVIIGKDIHVPVNNLYRNPKQVGQDRLVNACAGVKFYGAPLIIVDFGTAITFDIISKSAEYLGGIIVPGIEVSLEGLIQRAALLPKIEIQKPKILVGRDTVSSMNSGMVYGASCLVDGLLRKIKEKFFKNLTRRADRISCRKEKNILVVATGGYSKFISHYCDLIDKVDPCLTLRGIQFISAHLKSKS